MPLFGQDSIEEEESNGWRKSGVGSAKDRETGFKLRDSYSCAVCRRTNHCFGCIGANKINKRKKCKTGTLFIGR